MKFNIALTTKTKHQITVTKPGQSVNLNFQRSPIWVDLGSRTKKITKSPQGVEPPYAITLIKQAARAWSPSVCESQWGEGKK